MKHASFVCILNQDVGECLQDESIDSLRVFRFKTDSQLSNDVSSSFESRKESLTLIVLEVSSENVPDWQLQVLRPS
jgi:hypothetical protein